ncbi:hypothetical protein MRB53_033187 [Persea americana]|uniref:Uncharacterized protein n=1 Tax=Persea americana TaxID=3435 RepID=A0ACC2KTY5_PERAE|nr:hypothetical protein MRB53_033187 [Persea americana]
MFLLPETQKTRLLCLLLLRASKSLDREFASLALARKVVGDRIPVFHVKSSRLSVTGELLHTSGKEGFSDPFRFEIAGTEGREMGDKVSHFEFAFCQEVDGEAAISGKMVTNVDHLISSGPFFGRRGSKLESVDLHIFDRMEKINASLSMESVSGPSDVATCFTKCALSVSKQLVASNPLGLSSNQSEALNNGYLGLMGSFMTLFLPSQEAFHLLITSRS